jgi:hypothetical protein
MKIETELKTHLTKLVKKLCHKECRKEALDILFKSDAKIIGEFLFYYYSNSSNVACMVIDTAKDVLVKSGKMKQSKTDNFGGIHIQTWHNGE